jgi:hypothetical protein
MSAATAYRSHFSHDELVLEAVRFLADDRFCWSPNFSVRPRRLDADLYFQRFVIVAKDGMVEPVSVEEDLNAVTTTAAAAPWPFCEKKVPKKFSMHVIVICTKPFGCSPIPSHCSLFSNDKPKLIQKLLAREKSTQMHYDLDMFWYPRLALS